MPLQTQILRKNEPRELRWGWFHLDSIYDAIEMEGGTLTYREKGSYTFAGFHEYIDETDDEHFIILPGDMFHAWRI